MRGLSLRGRLTGWYGIVLVVVLGAFGVGVIWLQGQLGVRRIDRELEDVEATIVRITGNELAEGESPEASASQALDAVADGSLSVAVLAADRSVLAARPDGANVNAFVTGVARDVPGTVPLSGGSWRVRWRPERIGQHDVIVVTGRALVDLERERRQIQTAMFVGIPVALLLAGAGGWWLATIGLAPITSMARRASALPLTGSEDLGMPGGSDELGQLTLAFNGLVARLRSALQTQRQFMADASHELRTPASIIRSAAEVGLSREHRDEADYRETLAIIRNQSLRLGRLMDDMLVLARADAGGYPIRRVSIDLSELADDCQRAVKAMAAERFVALQWTATAEVPLVGDEELLRRLVLNLLQNAIHHSPPGGSVAIRVNATEAGAAIRVSDSGPGIPEADRRRIFDRFVRLDESRSGEGSGLGLSIARWIAEAHGGTLTIERSGPDGSTFCAALRSV